MQVMYAEFGLLCYSGEQPFSTAGLPSLLRPANASVGPAFPPLSTSLSSPSASSSTWSRNFAAAPHSDWQFHYLPRMPNQFERPHQVAPARPSVPFAIPAETAPSVVFRSSQMTSNSSVVDSTARLIAPQPSNVGNSSSLDDELLSWLVDIANNPNSLGADVDLNGILNGIVNESSARTDSAAAAAAAAEAGVASTAMTYPQTIPELQDPTDYSNLLSQIEQLNNFGKLT